MTGRVKFYNEFNGYGFIAGEDRREYFVHCSFIVGDGYKFLKRGESVDFEPVEAHSGIQAQQVKVAKRASEFALKPNPFTPQAPVTDPNRFAGRREIMRNAVDALFNHKNIIITGERGIGKSSVAYQLCYLAQGERALLEKLDIAAADVDFNYIAVDHRCVPGNTLLDVLESLRVSMGTRLRTKETKRTSEWGVDLKFIKAGGKTELELNHPTGLVPQFVEMIERAFHELTEDCNGLCFLIDEVDCLPVETQLASFLKAVSEALQFRNYGTVSFIVAGVTGTVTDLMTQHASFARLFENIELRRMENSELEEILVTAVRSVGVGIRDGTKRRIVELADNFPEPIHLLGYHTFRYDRNRVLGDDDFEAALAFITRELKRQEFGELYSRASEGLATPIVRAMALSEQNEFTPREIAEGVGASQSSVAGTLGDLGLRGVVVRVKHNRWQLRDPLFKTYLRWVLGTPERKEPETPGSSKLAGRTRRRKRSPAAAGNTEAEADRSE